MATTIMKAVEVRIKGIPVCRGIAIGKPFIFAFSDTPTPESKEIQDPNQEVMRYRRALDLCKKDIETLRKKMELEQIFEGAAILEAHLQILEDPLINDGIEHIIQNEHQSAEAAFTKTIELFHKRFASIEDSFFRERFKDIQDIARRVMGYLRQSIRISLSDVPPGSIVVANELSASEAAEADPTRVMAFVTEAGGMTTHAAIVAKAKGIPYVARVSFENVQLSTNTPIIVDGRTGDIIIDPDANTLAIYTHIQRQLTTHYKKLEHTSSALAETYDGLHMRLTANVEAVEEVQVLHQYGAMGVGLLRSEHVFLFKDTLPSEEEQYHHYRAFVKEMKGAPIVIRTFDIGGDKTFLGRKEGQDPLPINTRAIQYLLQEKNIFKNQLKAILRAAQYGNVSILFPMITSLPELREAKALLLESQRELEKQRIPHASVLRIGCMIEVPSAAIIADLLAKECDFLSIGTNDLVHYSLAVDRSHQAASSLTSLCHPSLLRLIKMVVVEANLQGIPVTVCGEIASDPRFTPILLGLGVHELSVACRYIPLVKNAIRCSSGVAAVELARVALSLGTSAEVQQLLAEAYKDAVPDDCYYNF